MPATKISSDPAASTAKAADFAAVQGGNNVRVPAKLVVIADRTVTAVNYTALVTDTLIAVTDTSVARTITLPLASTMAAGRVITIKDESGACATNNITVARTGSDTIDGATSAVLNANYQAKAFYSDGISKWFKLN